MQVSGDVSQVEAQLASLQQALLHGKDLLHHKLQEQMAACQQAEQVAQVCCCKTCKTAVGTCKTHAAGLCLDLRPMYC